MSGAKPGNPAGYAPAILQILLAENFAQVRFFIKDDEQLDAGSNERQIKNDRKRPEKHRAGSYQQKYSDVHRVSHKTIEAVHHEINWRVNWRASQGLSR